ncbi:MAG: hypothetical protein ABR564_05495 [Candidatus Dormibacteria bacterium]
MARACSVCIHPDRQAIDNDRSPSRRLAAHYQLSEAAIRRHRVAHVPHLPGDGARRTGSIPASDLAVQLRHAEELLAEVRRHRQDLLDRLVAAETGAAELRRLVAQAAGMPRALDGRTVEPTPAAATTPVPSRGRGWRWPWRGRTAGGGE